MRVAVAQMRSGKSADNNLRDIANLASAAAKQGAQYLLTPEMSTIFAQNADELKVLASETAVQHQLAQLSDIALSAGIYLHIGSMAYPSGEKFSNRSVLFSPKGQIMTCYDKIHLFDANIPNQAVYRESDNYCAGDSARIVKLEDTTLGMAICYDVRFGQLFSALAKSGAQIIAMPAAFTVPTGQAHWEVLLRARAIETGCFILASAQGGLHENTRATYGHSMIVSPWGEIIASLPHDNAGLIVHDLDLAQVQIARNKIPNLSNEREFTYPVQE